MVSAPHWGHAIRRLYATLLPPDATLSPMLHEQREPTMPTAGPEPRIDQRVVLTGLSWKQYEGLIAAVGERPALRMTYLDGTLDIMTTSPEHELDKTLLARLIEAFADEREIALIG